MASEINYVVVSVRQMWVYRVTVQYRTYKAQENICTDMEVTATITTFKWYEQQLN